MPPRTPQARSNRFLGLSHASEKGTTTMTTQHMTRDEQIKAVLSAPVPICAGHEDARAVHPTYPDPTPNPYRQTEGA